MKALTVDHVVIIDDQASLASEAFKQYEKDHLKPIKSKTSSVTYEKETTALLATYQDKENTSQFELKYVALADKICKEIQQAIAKDIKILFLGSDLDNLVSSFIIYFLMTKQNINYSRGLTMMRERRMKIQLDQL